MRRLIVLFAAVAVLVGLVTPAATAAPRTGPPLTAMTLNLYVGADIFRLLAPAPECAGVPTPPGPEACSVIVQAGATLDEVDSTDYPARAVELARLIRQRRPHVVGLQEVSRLTRIPTDPFGSPTGPPVATDYLDILLAELNQRGPGYEVAAVVDNVDTPFIPAGTFVTGVGPVVEELVNLLDRDVILVRSDVDYDPASAFGAAYQSAQLSVDLAGESVEFTRSWVTIDLTLKGVPVKVVNTHLETQSAIPALIPANAIQAAQAAELMGILGAETGHVVLVGDFNSDPFTDNLLPGVPTPYEIIAGSGFTDAWTLRRGRVVPGYTCCQASDLTNRKSEHDERIDLVWVRSGAGDARLAWVKTAGARHRDKTPSGLWPTDHAGVVARLLLPR